MEDPATGEQRIRLASSTAGASIRYTTAGDPPTIDEGVIYERPFPVNYSVTIKALAYQSEMNASEVTVASYPRTDTPGHSSGGRFRCNRDIHLESTTEGASIRYTVDGSEPTSANGQGYSEGLRISESAVVKAMAFAEGGINSGTVTIAFEIDDSPVDSPEPSDYEDVYIGPQTIAFEEQEETSIRYTLDGSDPDLAAGIQYDSPIN